MSTDHQRLSVKVESLVGQVEMDSPDFGVEGIYEVEVDASLTRADAERAALDTFSDIVTIACSAHFRITVL